MTVPAGWVPYRYGQWVWLRPWGWTWVDDAPWGFAPFHYGRWLWWGNRWCWSPGPLVRRPVYAPALVAWVGGPHSSVGIGSRPAPAWGWVPLGPREAYTPGYRASPGHLRHLNPHLPAGPMPPPAYVNRGVPGAVTVLPAPGFAPRQPVRGAALRGDDLLRGPWASAPFQGRGPDRPDRAPPRRETVAPRVAMPGPAAAATPPAAPVEAGRDAALPPRQASPHRPPPSSLPPANPRPDGAGPAPTHPPAPQPKPGPAATGPFGGRPVQDAAPPRAERERPPAPVEPAPTAPNRAIPASPQPHPKGSSQADAPHKGGPAPATPGQPARPLPPPGAPAQSAVPVAPQPSPTLGVSPFTVPAAKPGDSAAGRASPDERRRTPEPRQPGRER
jgi:hypothetical protein